MPTYIGQIIAWSGTTPPANWSICDGTGGTPDLRGKFIYGKSNDSETVTGGANSHTHNGGTVSSVGNHQHSVTVTLSAPGGVGRAYSTAANVSYGGHTHSANFSLGDGGSHTHTASLASADSRPPYILLYYIMRMA